MKTLMIQIKQIDLDVPNHRLARTEADIAELAASIEADGLKQPVEVWAKPTKRKGTPTRYTLGFGEGRYLAHKLLKRAMIEAVVRFPDEYDVVAIRASKATENLQRTDLSPVEEALAIADLFDGDAAALMHVGDGNDEALDIDKAAEAIAPRIAKPTPWVRERLRLARLDPEVRQMLAGGKIPLAHALRIASVSDPKIQKQLAARCLPDKDQWGRRKGQSHGRPGIKLTDLDDLVLSKLETLRGAPFLLDKPFAGAPACDDCPDNGGNQFGLFNHNPAPKQDAPKVELRCLNPACLKKKMSAANRKIDAFVKLCVNGKQQPTTTAAKEYLPEWVKPSTATRRAKKSLGPNTTKLSKEQKAKSGSHARAGGYDAKLADKTNKLSDASRKREKALVEAIRKKMPPHARMMLRALESIWQLSDAEAKKLRSILKAGSNPDACAKFFASVDGNDLPCEGCLYQVFDDDAWADDIAQLIGVPVPEPVDPAKFGLVWDENHGFVHAPKDKPTSKKQSTAKKTTTRKKRAKPPTRKPARRRKAIRKKATAAK